MLKKIVTTLLVCLSITGVVCASSVNMNLTSRTNTVANTTTKNSVSGNDIGNDVTNQRAEENENSIADATSAEPETNVTSVNNINDVSSSSMGINQILNIFLIAIGLILILLAIAILIRLKR